MSGDMESCRSCKSPVYWQKTDKGKWCPFDWGSDQSHFLTCPDANAWSHTGRANEIKTDDPPKYITRVGKDLVIVRPPGGGIVEIARQREGWIVTAEHREGFGVPMTDELLRQVLGAAARSLFGVELEQLEREALAVPLESDALPA